MHEREIIVRSDFCQSCRSSGVGLPCARAVIFGAIDVVVRSAVDDCLILTPRSRRGNIAGGDIEFLAREEFDMRSSRIDLAQGRPELARGSGAEDLPQGHWGEILSM